jgi:hypothetical protein
MHDGLLPLFPLSVVLLPRNDLPLHIFEERYKLMIEEVIEQRSEFGVVLAAGGGISASGCTAAIDRVLKRYEDGRLDILTSGHHRFTIRSLDQGKQYLRGEVDYVSDDGAVAEETLRHSAVKSWRRLAPDAAQDPPHSDPELSFLLAREIDDLEFRQRLLTTYSEPGRLKLLVDFIPGYLDRTDASRRLKKTAGLNGHGKRPDLPPDAGAHE